MSVKAGLSTFRGHRTPNFDLVGRRNWWFALSGFFLVLSLFGLFVRGLNFSIDFKGGALLSFPNSSGAPISQYQDVLARYHVREATVEVVNGTQIQIRTQSLSGANLTNPGSTPSSGTSPSPTVGTSPSASVGTTPSGTATPTPTATATPTPSASVSATPTATSTAAATPTVSPTPAISPTPAPPLVADELRVALARVAHISPDAINEQDVGPTWGGTISSKAVQGLIIFLILVTAYISFRFEPKMAGGALAALLHDLVVTAGIYALVGRQVTPASVIAILTILGYSLYDTVVIFDKVKENTDQAALVARETYGGMVNLSLNQTLMRSVNTSLVVLLPIGSLLLFGGSTLKDFAFALFVGVASGTYSSIFVASPILVILKEREPRYQQIRARVATRAAKPGLRPVRAAAAMGDGSADGDGQGPAVVTPTSRARTGARTGQSSGQRSGRQQGSGGGGRKKSSRSKPKRKRR